MEGKESSLRPEWRAAAQKHYEKTFPAAWARMMESLRAERGDAFYLCGASFYLLSLGGVRIAVDPAFVVPSVREALLPRLAADFQSIDYVLLTHDHADHYSPEIAAAVRDARPLWLVPTCMRRGDVYPGRGDFDGNGLPLQKVRWIREGESVELPGIRIESFRGLHHYDGGTDGPDSLGYLLCGNGRRILLPGDVRDFRPELLPPSCMENLDWLIAHMYLGAGNAAAYPFTEPLGKWIRFFSAPQANTVAITHLYEWSSPDGRFWNFCHAGAAMDALYALRPEAEVQIPVIGRRYEIKGIRKSV